jgi:hypothetical protein
MNVVDDDGSRVEVRNHRKVEKFVLVNVWAHNLFPGKGFLDVKL